MFYSFRNKLFAISVTLLAVFMLGIGVYLHQTLRDWTESRIEQDLRIRAELVVTAIDAAGASPSDEQFVQQLADPDDPNQRITLVDADGTVLADTHLTVDEIGDAENHADRPEFQSAITDEVGIARRFSDTVGMEMLYAAVPTDDQQSVIRVAVPLQEVEDALGHLRLLLLFGGFIGIGVAIFMSSVASRMMSGVLQKVLDRARPEGRVTADGSMTLPSGETVDDSTSLYQVAERLEETLDLLVRERNRFRAVLDGMTEGIIATDGDQTITLSNRAAVELLDADGKLNDRQLGDALPGDVAAALFDSPDESVEFELQGPPSRTIHVRATPRPASDGLILVLHDVTTLRQLETMRRDFVANVSHELKTPVTVIQANAETLLDGALDDADHARSFTQGIHRNAERLSHLIADLLDLSRIESGEADLRLESLPLKNVVLRAAEDIDNRHDGGPGVDVRIDDALEVTADFDALHRVLLNLMDNAVKYSTREEPVEVAARRRDGVVLVEVRDDGPGIAEEHEDRIFERFYRVDGGRATEKGGTGLGLSIVKHLVASMDGEVGYRRRDEGGSIFWFTLPEHLSAHG